MNAPLTQAVFVRPIPTLAELIEQHRALQVWTPENDGQDHAVADQIKVALMAGDCGPLSKDQADYLVGGL